MNDQRELEDDEFNELDDMLMETPGMKDEEQLKALGLQKKEREMYRLAQQCVENKDFENALHFYEQIIESCDPDLPLILEYATLCKMANRENLAVDLYEGILSLYPLHRVTLRQYVKLLYEIAENQGDVKFVQRAIDLLTPLANKLNSMKDKKLLAQVQDDLKHALHKKEILENQTKRPSIKNRRFIGPISAAWANESTQLSTTLKEEKNASTRKRTSVSKGKTQECFICGQKAEFKCSQCNSTSYCGRECQTKDWANHKKICAKIRKYSDAVKKDQKDLQEKKEGILEKETSSVQKGKLIGGNAFETVLYFLILAGLVYLFATLFVRNFNEF